MPSGAHTPSTDKENVYGIGFPASLRNAEEYQDFAKISRPMQETPVGVSEPFPLFRKEAVKQMRAEILSEKVWEEYQYSSNLSHCQLRGYAPEYVPFIYDAWKSPEVLEIVSKIAGIDLVPVMDWEIGHINIEKRL